MAADSLENAAGARAALHAIVSDPAYGADALSSPLILANLLQDFLPDAPRETGLLTAAAEKDLAGMLREYVSQGMDAGTAVRLTATSFAGSTAFTAEACNWAAAELAEALGLVAARDIPGLALPARSAGSDSSDGPRATGDVPPTDRTELLTLVAGNSPADQPARRPRRAVIWLPAFAAAVVAVAAVAFALGRPSPADLSPRGVVRAYIAAVNRRDWPRAWHLGGKNLGQPYGTWINGYQQTSRIVITRITATGGAVEVRALAYETGGRVQSYQLNYLVSAGVITAGQSTLLTTTAHGQPTGAPATCGSETSAADIMLTVQVVRGPVTCSVAMKVEQDYSAALRAGAAPGNGGGGPVTVDGWTCQTYPTTEISQTRKASECTRNGSSEIQEIIPITADCTRSELSKALVAANPQLATFSWHLASFACNGGWAAVSINAPSIGPGEAFLQQGATGWNSGQLNGAIYQCADLAASFTPPIPPQLLAEYLFSQVNRC